MTGMTGYAYREFQSEERSGSVEIKGYNNRYLDVTVNLPGRLSPLEPGIREFVSQGINRGRVEVSVRVRELAGSAEITIDRTLARTYVAGLKELAHTAGIEDTVTLSDVLSLEGVLSIDRSVDHDEYAAFLMPHLQNAFEVFCEARQSEGDAVAGMVELQLQAIDALVSSLTEHSARLETHITTTIRARFEEVVPDAVDDSRILGETAVLLVKYSIQEELDRLRFHLDSCRKLLSEPGAVGKKLDFLCQEIGREINTIGSKSIIPEINSCVVDAKNALENIREQLRNVE